MTRNMPWLIELQPQMFVEMSKELAKELGVKNGDKVIVSSPRGQIWAIAIVTDKIKPLKVMGHTCYIVAMPWHYGWRWA